MQTATYNIVRRAFGKYALVDTVQATWFAAMQIADMMTTYNRDGEYDIRPEGEPIGPRNPGNNACGVQRAFAYL